MDGCERLVETLFDQAADAGGVPDLCGKDLCLQVVE
jgi:hypothetical protein